MTSEDPRDLFSKNRETGPFCGHKPNNINQLAVSLDSETEVKQE